MEGVWQALQLVELPERTVSLLEHCVWNICHLLQQFPHLLDYVMHHMCIITNVTSCILTTSSGDSHTAAITLETKIPVKF